VKVFLIRHSHAVDEHAELADADRYLSNKGREVARKVGARLRQDAVLFDALLTSPLVRAVQTAELIAREVDFPAPVVALPALAPGMSIRAAAETLPSYGASVACVGHEPGISALAARLIGAASAPGFRPCQVVLIEDGAVSWTLSPDQV
jgi:phosphohistidine phosphatase